MQRHSEGIEPAAGPAGESLPARCRRFLGRIGAGALLHILFVAIVAAVALWRPAAIEDRIEGRLLDWRFRARNAYALLMTRNAFQPPLQPRIVIVAVDQASIDRYGEFPWPWLLVANLVEKISAGRPRAIGVDLLLHDLKSTYDHARIAEALTADGAKTATAVEFPLGLPFAGAVPERLLADAITRVDRPARLLPPEAAGALLPPGPVASATVLGHAVCEADATGKVRSERLYLRYGGALIPSLAFQTARIAAGVPPEQVRIRGDGRVELGGTIVPADRRGRLLVKYYGGEGTFRPYSAVSVLTGETSPEAFADAVVFIGITEITTEGRRPLDTPFAESLPAVEKDATVAANILARDFLREAPAAADLLVLLAAGAAVPLLLRRRAALSLLCLQGLALALVAAHFALFLRGFQFALGWPLLVLLPAGGIAVLRQHLTEIRVSRRMRRLFSSYVTERVLEQLIANPAMARPGGERRELTILFADIRGFTSFSEQHPPEEVVGTLNEYLEAMTDVVFRWEGTVDKFIGDTILAFWGAPLPQEDHAERALRCALHMCSRLDRLNDAWAAAGRPALEIGIGITTGQVLVGNIGAEGKKMDYTVIGDQVNVCSRVEELTKEFRARILVTASTFTLLEPVFAAGAVGHVFVEGLAAVAVKGKEEPVRLYRVSPLERGMATRVEESGASPPGV